MVYVQWDSEVEAQIAHERKVALLDALEAQWRAEHEASDAGYYATSYSSWLSYGTGLLANIVENLQVTQSTVQRTPQLDIGLCKCWTS